jgi:UDP-MurNAc hydroxylase
MRATSLGHAGILIETAHGSILCDPWFIPAFLGSWCVFPRNDQLSTDLLDRIHAADFLYISHLHGDHHDEPWLKDHLRRDIPVLLPGYPTREQQRRMEALGFTHFIATVDTEEIEIAPGLRVAIHVETSITDGPAGDSALVVSDGQTRLVNQNDCRTTDLSALSAHGPVDLHWLQYSGAIWYPMVYEMPEAEKRERCAAKVDSQFTRAMRYVDTIGARAVVPSAGPPAFLDPDLFHLNVITGDEPSIFPDQISFIDRLTASGHHGVLAIPGTEIDITPTEITVTHPLPNDDVQRIFTHKEQYLRSYQADWSTWLSDLRASWSRPEIAADPDGHDLINRLANWWQPLLAMAPTLRAAVGGNCLIRAFTSDPKSDPKSDPDAGPNSEREPVQILIDFPAGEVRAYDGEPCDFRFDLNRDLLELVAREHAVDWSNSLFLSCRFKAWRAGDFNEYLYNFFKSLSVERMRRTEAEAVRKLNPLPSTEADVEIGNYLVQRRCPHRNADLSVFGEIEGDQLVCTLHGWRFDVHTGKCLTSEDHPLRIRRQEKN